MNDKHLLQLYAKKAEICSLATPTVFLSKDGKTTTAWIDETNHPLLPKSNEMIEQRIEHIKKQIL